RTGECPPRRSARRAQVSSSTCRSSFPSASEATSLGRRNPRRKNRGESIIKESILAAAPFEVNLKVADRPPCNDFRRIDLLLHRASLNGAHLPAVAAFGENDQDFVL